MRGCERPQVRPTGTGTIDPKRPESTRQYASFPSCQAAFRKKNSPNGETVNGRLIRRTSGELLETAVGRRGISHPFRVASFSRISRSRSAICQASACSKVASNSRAVVTLLPFLSNLATISRWRATCLAPFRHMPVHTILGTGLPPYGVLLLMRIILFGSACSSIGSASCC
jgi:hypothetical protein